MTPAIFVLKKQHVMYEIHEYQHDSNAVSYGHEAAEKMGVSASQVYKTLVVCLDDKTMAVAVLPVSEKLSMKLFAKVLGAKKARMADKQAVARSTGYVLGGVSPLGQKKQLKTVIDCSAKKFEKIYISAGKRGLEIALDPKDLSKTTGANFAVICQ